MAGVGVQFGVELVAGSDDRELPSLLLSKTLAAASFHVGISGFVRVGVGVLAWIGDGGGNGRLMFASQSLLLSEAAVATESHLHVAWLSSLSLLKTRAFACSHVGITGIFGAGATEIGVGLGVVSRQMSPLSPDKCDPTSVGSARVGVAAVIGCSVCAGSDGVPLVIVDGSISCDTWLSLLESLPPHIFCSDTSVSSHTLRMRGCRRNFVASVVVP